MRHRACSGAPAQACPHVVVPHQELADSADGVTKRKAGGGRCQHRKNRHPTTAQQHESGQLSPAGHAGIHGVSGQAAGKQSVMEQPLADAKENWVDGALPPTYCAAGRRARLDVCECRICHAPSALLSST